MYSVYISHSDTLCKMADSKYAALYMKEGVISDRKITDTHLTLTEFNKMLLCNISIREFCIVCVQILLPSPWLSVKHGTQIYYSTVSTIEILEKPCFLGGNLLEQKQHKKLNIRLHVALLFILHQMWLHPSARSPLYSSLTTSLSIPLSLTNSLISS